LRYFFLRSPAFCVGLRSDDDDENFSDDPSRPAAAPGGGDGSAPSPSPCASVVVVVVVSTAVAAFSSSSSSFAPAAATAGPVVVVVVVVVASRPLESHRRTRGIERNAPHLRRTRGTNQTGNKKLIRRCLNPCPSAFIYSWLSWRLTNEIVFPPSLLHDPFVVVDRSSRRRTSTTSWKLSTSTCSGSSARATRRGWDCWA